MSYYDESIGKAKEYLDFIFEEIKEKASRIHTWKGTKRTVRHQSRKKYLKVHTLYLTQIL
jgi:hypothetical protein